MTHIAGDKILRLDRDYVELEDGGGDGGGGEAIPEVETPRCSCGGDGGGGGGLWWWSVVKLVLVALFFAVMVVVFFEWIGPFIMNKEIIPTIRWIETFSKTKLAFLIFGSLAIFPTLLLPSSPSMWVAGMTFGYGYGFLLTIAGVAIGVSVPYLIGSLFYHRIQAWLDRYPKNASVIRLAGEGGFLNQSQAVMLIRIAPFPYIIYNYCAVATDVKYGPYLAGTLVGVVPEIFLTLYTGILIQTLANASAEQPLSATQIICTVAGFCLTAAATFVVTLFAKKRLRTLHMEDGLLLDGAT
ncbi:uncharacterized protein LOC127250100 [Andrographis paniculata]|uniref:uncharacterized protein LOC127250100 n=1 Tax=Andrographis paniculata TaxID=175694 RepID=UPI0021E86A5C|nr:uncharacterized protein LOC127250100 [Andrographis paniculata]